MITDNQKKYIVYSGITVLILLAVFLLVLSVSGLRGYKYIGHGLNQNNTISVTGQGEIYAVPDTATFSYSIIETGATPKDAVSKAAGKNNAILSAVKDLGVDEKDIQTTGYNVYPKYKYTKTVCPQERIGTDGSVGIYAPCYNGDQVISGYEVNETLTVKVRNTDKAGTILAKIGEMGVSNVSGLNFVIDDPDALQQEARDKAIADAKSKANILSKSLGIKLDKIVNFYENGNPVIYSAKGMGMAYDAAMPSAIPEISTGQNKIVSNVTIIYEVD